jgi:hypothetical protein
VSEARAAADSAALEWAAIVEGWLVTG